MPKLSIETLEEGARVSVSVGAACDDDVQTRFHIPRPSSRPPAPPGDDEPTEPRMTVPRFRN